MVKEESVAFTVSNCSVGLSGLALLLPLLFILNNKTIEQTRSKVRRTRVILRYQTSGIANEAP